MRHHFTGQDVLDREIVPLLGQHAKYFDLAGFCRRFVEYDQDRDLYFMPENTPWAKVSEHVLKLDVSWTAAADEYNALYEIYTPHARAEDTVLASGYFKATEDGYVSLANLDAALSLEGYERGTIVARGGDFDTFEVTTS